MIKVSRLLPVLGLAALLSVPTRAEDRTDDEISSVASASGVVVHGVTTGPLASAFQAIDDKLAAGRPEAAAAALDELLAGELGALHEQAQGVYLRASEAAVLRIAALPPVGLTAWRRLADPRANSLVARAAAGEGELLERGAERLALATPGPRLMVMLADRRLARGDVRGAAQACEALLGLWPAGSSRDELPGVERAAVVSRLAAALEALGDEASLRELLHRSAPTLLDAPSAALPEHTVHDELERAATRAAARSRGTPAPTGALRMTGELLLRARDLTSPLPETGREIYGHPAPFTSAGRSGLLVRVTDATGTLSRLYALGLPDAGGPTTAPQRLRDLWAWPSQDELRRWPRAAAERAPFRPVVVGDFVLACWPSTRNVPSEGVRHVDVSDEEVQDLVVLSLRAEGRLVDERGAHEWERDDPDVELERLSFTGSPLVVGRAVYATAVGRSPGSGATELHVARFDLMPYGSEVRLRLRWRRHVMDGTPIAPSRYTANARLELERELAAPTGLAERNGRVYVGSNTGAVASLDTESGEVVWLETYERLGPSPRRTVVEGEPVGWKYGPVHLDGSRVVVAPRDAESLLLYAAHPLPSRSTRLAELPMRGGGTALRAGSPLGDLVPDELVGVRDGIALLSGYLPARGSRALRWPPSPLVAYRVRRAREGEPARRMRVPEIPEMACAGSPALLDDAVLFPTYKALYRVSLDDVELPPRELWRATFRPGSLRLPDRLGNVVIDGTRVWSLSLSRIVLFEPAE